MCIQAVQQRGQGCWLLDPHAPIHQLHVELFLINLKHMHASAALWQHSLPATNNSKPGLEAWSAEFSSTASTLSYNLRHFQGAEQVQDYPLCYMLCKITAAVHWSRIINSLQKERLLMIRQAPVHHAYEVHLRQNGDSL